MNIVESCRNDVKHKQDLGMEKKKETGNYMDAGK
jgi:hypothetical protein